MATRSNMGDSTIDMRATLTKFLNGPLTILAPMVGNFVAKTRTHLPDLYHDPAAHLPAPPPPCAGLLPLSPPRHPPSPTGCHANCRSGSGHITESTPSNDTP